MMWYSSELLFLSLFSFPSASLWLKQWFEFICRIMFPSFCFTCIFLCLVHLILNDIFHTWIIFVCMKKPIPWLCIDCTLYIHVYNAHIVLLCVIFFINKQKHLNSNRWIIAQKMIHHFFKIPLRIYF